MVMYTKDREPVWGTDTWENKDPRRIRLTLTNAGHLVLDNNAKTVQSAETSNGTKTLRVSMLFMKDLQDYDPRAKCSSCVEFMLYNTISK